MVEERYFILCTECEMEVDLEQTGEYTFVCPVCETVYNPEDGIRDREVETEMEKLYNGLVIAGIVGRKYNESEEGTDD